MASFNPLTALSLPDGSDILGRHFGRQSTPHGTPVVMLAITPAEEYVAGQVDFVTGAWAFEQYYPVHGAGYDRVTALKAAMITYNTRLGELYV